MSDQHEDDNQGFVGVPKSSIYPPSIMYKLDEDQFRQIIDTLEEIAYPSRGKQFRKDNK